MLYKNRLDISKFTHPGENEIVLELTVSHRNLFGPHHHGELEESEKVGPYSFELPGTWHGGQSDMYTDTNSFVPAALC